MAPQGTPASTGYDEEKFDDGYFRSRYETHEAANRAWSRGTAEVLTRNLTPGRALDVGCGVGFLVESWRDLGVDGFGVDVAEEALDMAAPELRGHLSRCNVLEEPLPFPSDHFDLVTCIEVVEHLPAHDAYLREVHRVLKPGGFLFEQTPKPGTPEALGDPTHISVKSRREWVDLHVDAGFEVAETAFYRWEHELPMTSRGERLGWIRYTPPLKWYVVKSGTRTLYRKPLGG